MPKIGICSNQNVEIVSDVCSEGKVTEGRLLVKAFDCGFILKSVDFKVEGWLSFGQEPLKISLTEKL